MFNRQVTTVNEAFGAGLKLGCFEESAICDVIKQQLEALTKENREHVSKSDIYVEFDHNGVESFLKNVAPMIINREMIFFTSEYFVNIALDVDYARYNKCRLILGNEPALNMPASISLSKGHPLLRPINKV